MVRLLKYALLGFVLVFLASALALALRTPSHDRDWLAGQDRMPRATQVGELIEISDYRDFRYGAGGGVAVENYRVETFDPAEIESLWYGVSHFGPLGLAHTFLSFGFSDGRKLVLEDALAD